MRDYLLLKWQDADFYDISHTLPHSMTRIAVNNLLVNSVCNFCYRLDTFSANRQVEQRKQSMALHCNDYD